MAATRSRAPAGALDVDARALAQELRAAIEGEVRFSAGDRALWATTGSNYRQLPIGVVLPRTVDDVVATHALCREFGAPIVSRGGGTSLAGQCINVAVVIDFSKYLTNVLEIDPERKLARIEPGVILDHLREQAERQHRLTFGPDPSTHDHCTLGGMIGANSCGVRSVMAQFYGPGPRTSDNVHELEVLTYRGERLRVGPGGAGVPDEIAAKLRDLVSRYGDLVRERYPQIPRRVSGYNLDDLLPEKGFHVARALAGTEGTCVTVLEATVHLLHSPSCRTLVVAGYEDAAVAADHVMDVLGHKPLGLEGVDEQLIEDMTMLGKHVHDLSLLPEGRGWLLIEVGGETKTEADDRGREIVAALEKAGGGLRGTKLYDDPESEEHVWKVREAGLGATAFLPGKPDTYEGWEDSAVPPERLGEYLRKLKQLADRYGYESALYGHYGQGCVHARWNFDLSSAEGIATWRRFLDAAADLVLSLGGSLSGEHGDGQSRAELLPRMFGEELVEGFREFKAIWDPDWRMNPGKVVEPNAITSNLKLGVDYRPKPVQTHFAYGEDGGSFAHATTRCVGIGNCRHTKGGVMCPSYMVTREEKHSTRGRAHLLWEMLNNDEIPVWRSDEVLDALDLCLSCKGCTNDCPVNVDMPTLKAEFLAHHYERKPRPRHAYAFGLIDRWARVACHAPGLANVFTQTPVLASIAKAAAGVSPRRELPKFAPVTFRSWFGRRTPQSHGGAPVILWPDTFTNHFEPEIGAAAVEVLEDAGFSVLLPRTPLCCGRPLYDYGFLALARQYLERVLDALRDEIRAGVPIVGVEPSCVAVFRDELTKMLPHDEDAKRLAKQTFHFAEFLCEHAEGWEPPPLHRHVLLHGHCHERATKGFEPTGKLLQRMGAELEKPDSGCCGMAGAWGYEEAHYDVSLACAERVLLPAVRDTAPATVIVTNGFSCRSQIEQLGPGRQAVHVAQALQLARDHGADGPSGAYPERACRPLQGRRRRGRTVALAAGASVAAATLAAARKRR
jgi:FAD/FMN-containing dehydrogenase/Fe-S oxidoreductase